VSSRVLPRHSDFGPPEMPADRLATAYTADMPIHRIKARWTGFNGAPGYSVFHGDAATEGVAATAQDQADAVRLFFDGIVSRLPSIVRINVESQVEVLDETTGQIIDIVAITQPPTSAGAVAGSYSAPSGAVINWNTNGVRNGRRVRGKTFLVPLAGTAYDGDGTLISSVHSQIQAAATTLAESFSGLVTFARPTAPGAADGAIYPIVSATVPDKAAILRSRRD